MFRIIVALVGAALIMSAALAQNSGEHEPNTQIPKIEGRAQSVAPGPQSVIVNVVPPSQTKEERKEEAKERHDKAELDRKVTEYTGQLALFTMGLFAATVALVIATIGLVVIGLRQARDGRDAVVKLQRAFVSLEAWRFLSHRDSSGKVWWSFHFFAWKNSGASPAIKAKFDVHRYLEDVDMPRDFKFEVRPDRSEIFVGPQATVGTGNLGVTADELVAVREGKKFLYLWGRVDYRDIFDDTPDHVTKFAFQVLDFRGDVTNEWSATNAVEMITRHLNRHNCADESCAPE
jgi:hypothetical protein